MTINIAPVSQISNKSAVFKADVTTNQQHQNLPKTGDTLELSNKKENKNLLKMAALGAGIIAVGIAAYCYLKKGKAKTSDVKETASTAAENVRKFFDKDNKVVEGVKLDKGKALAGDGTGFTGIFKTTDKAGRNITISYADGVMAFSEINGKLFKSYNYFKHKTTGNFVTKICEHLNDGTKQLTEHWFHDNGKIKYIIKAPKGADDCRFGTLVGYSKSGKKILEAQNDPDNQIIFAKFFDENGNMYKHRHAVYKPNGWHDFTQEDIIKNGEVVTIRRGGMGGNLFEKILSETPVSPDIVIKNDMKYTSSKTGLTVLDGKNGQYNCHYDFNGNPLVICGSGRSCVVINPATGEIYTQNLPKDKNFLQDFFDKIEDMIKVAKEENMNVKLVDKDTEGFDIPKGVQILKEHFLKA